MRVRGALVGLIILAIIIGAPSAALAFNQRITVYASVPEMRYIYVDKSGIITKVVGNTSNNIDPKVVNEDNQPLTMTESINKQYEAFLKDHHYHIAAGQFYYVNSMTVNSKLNNQNIKISTAELVF